MLYTSSPSQKIALFWKYSHVFREDSTSFLVSSLNLSKTKIGCTLFASKTSTYFIHRSTYLKKRSAKREVQFQPVHYTNSKMSENVGNREYYLSVSIPRISSSAQKIATLWIQQYASIAATWSGKNLTRTSSAISLSIRSSPDIPMFAHSTEMW